jgi:hypothetical protein
MASNPKRTPPRPPTDSAAKQRSGDGRGVNAPISTRDAVRDIIRRYRETFDRLAR